MSLAALLLALLPAPRPALPALPAASIERRAYLMGTRVELGVTAPDPDRALDATEAALAALRAAERRLSTWTEGSELSRFLAAPVGTRIELSPELAEELAAAGACRTATGGAFDPAVGPLVAAWGIRSGGRRPTAAELAAARDAARWDALELDGRFGIRRRPDLRLDEGGFGKGAGLDHAVAALVAAGAGPSWIDLGGQVATTGRFVAAVAHPDDRERAVVGVTLDAGSLSTTGNGERGIVVDGRRRGHVLDPRTGQPARDFGSVTVWARRAFDADCLSTGLYVLGPEGALAWAAGRPDLEVLLLERDGDRLRARSTPGLAARLRVLDPTVDLEPDPPEERER